MQETVRAESLFLDVVPLELCGVSIHPMNIQHFSILAEANNGVLVNYGNLFEAASLIYVLRKRKFGRLLNLLQILWWARKKKKEDHFTTLEEIITNEASTFVNRNLMDLPGRYSEPGSGNINPLDFPRINYAVERVAIVMHAFPSLSLDELKVMPLPLFWQFLRMAIQKSNPEYLGTQPTDLIKTWGLVELRKLKAAESQIS